MRRIEERHREKHADRTEGILRESDDANEGKNQARDEEEEEDKDDIEEDKEDIDYADIDNDEEEGNNAIRMERFRNRIHPA